MAYMAQDKAFVGLGKASIGWGRVLTSSSIKTHIGSCGRLCVIKIKRKIYFNIKNF